MKWALSRVILPQPEQYPLNRKYLRRVAAEGIHEQGRVRSVHTRPLRKSDIGDKLDDYGKSKVASLLKRFRLPTLILRPAVAEDTDPNYIPLLFCTEILPRSSLTCLSRGGYWEKGSCRMSNIVEAIHTVKGQDCM